MALPTVVHEAIVLRNFERHPSIFGKSVARYGLSANDPMYGPAVRCKWISPSWR
jgi:hypothetical protein